METLTIGILGKVTSSFLGVKCTVVQIVKVASTYKVCCSYVKIKKTLILAGKKSFNIHIFSHLILSMRCASPTNLLSCRYSDRRLDRRSEYSTDAPSSHSSHSRPKTRSSGYQSDGPFRKHRHRNNRHAENVSLF